MARNHLPARPEGRDHRSQRGRWPRRGGNPPRPIGSSQPGGDRADRRRPIVRRAAVAVIGLALVSYAWVDATAPPFSTRALVGVLIPGAMLVTIAYGWSPKRIAPPERLDVTGTSFWVIAITMLFEWEASAFRDNSWPWHPSLTNLINPLLAPHPLKSAAIVVWMLAGWGLVKR